MRSKCGILGPEVKVKVSVTQSYPTLCNPQTVAHQAPLYMGFSRQEYWSGLPFPVFHLSPDPPSPSPSLVPRAPGLTQCRWGEWRGHGSPSARPSQAGCVSAKDPAPHEHSSGGFPCRGNHSLVALSPSSLPCPLWSHHTLPTLLSTIPLRTHFDFACSDSGV